MKPIKMSNIKPIVQCIWRPPYVKRGYEYYTIINIKGQKINKENQPFECSPEKIMYENVEALKNLSKTIKEIKESIALIERFLGDDYVKLKEEESHLLEKDE